MLRRLRLLDHRLAVLLLAGVLLLRIVVPAGWMPTAGTGGLPGIAICTGMGPEQVWLGVDGKLHHGVPTHDQHDPQPCGFSVLAFGLDLPVIAVVHPQQGVHGPVIERQHNATVGRGLAAPPPPATGPPFLI